MPETGETPAAAAWRAALAELEDGLRSAQEASTGSLEYVPAGQWRAPTGCGPMPEDLRERAEDLLARHRHLLEALHRAQHDVGKHLSALEAIPSGSRTDQSVYLDVAG